MALALCRPSLCNRGEQRGRLLTCCGATERAQRQAYERFLANKARRSGQFIGQNELLSTEPLDLFIEDMLHGDRESALDPRPLRRASSHTRKPVGEPSSDRKAGLGAERDASGLLISRPAPVPTLRKHALPLLPGVISGTTPEVYMFWDLEAMHPEDQDPRVLAVEVLAVASAYGQMAGKYVYSIRKGWNWVPTYFLQLYAPRHAPGSGPGPAAATTAAPAAAVAGSAAAAGRRNTYKATLGKIRRYTNSAGASFTPTRGHQLSIKYVLEREGCEARLVQNRDEAVDRAINGGIDKLLYQVSVRGSPNRSLVLFLVSDSARHAPLLARCKDLGMHVVIVQRQTQPPPEVVGQAGLAPQSVDALVRHADVVLYWERIRAGSYILPVG